MILASETHGSGREVTFIHGFTQTRTSWLPVVRLLGGVRATLLDAPGHGGSPNGARTLPECGDDIAESSPGGILVGYSMGARMALHAALAHPGHFSGLVLVSGTAGIEDASERAVRVDSDTRLAARIEEIGTERFIPEWLSNPMFSGLSEDMRMTSERVRNSAHGLAESLRHAGTGTQANLWPRLGDLPMPVLIVAGGQDAKFAAIAVRMADAVPSSELRVFPGCGHTVHLEDVAAFCDILGQWMLSAVPAPDPRST